MRRAGTVLLALTLLAGALAGCSDDEAEPGRPTASAASGPELVADPQGSTTCLAGRDGQPAQDRYSVSQATAVASGDLTVVGAEALGTGVSLFASEGVLVTDNSVPSGFGDTQWPIGLDGPAARKTFDVDSRTDLVGMQLSEGQRVQPLLGLELAQQDGVELTGVRLSYTSGDGSTTGTVDLPLDYDFPTGPCPSDVPSPSPVG